MNAKKNALFQCKKLRESNADRKYAYLLTNFKLPQA